jgi:hypothetical protein
MAHYYSMAIAAYYTSMTILKLMMSLNLAGTHTPSSVYLVSATS